MHIHVKLFAVLRETAGAAEITLELPDGATAASVRQPLLEQFPSLAAHLSRAAYAINRTYADPQAVLRDGDELALLPPVSGG